MIAVMAVEVVKRDRFRAEQRAKGHKVVVVTVMVVRMGIVSTVGVAGGGGGD